MRVHHAAGPEKQQRLEERVREQVKHAGGDARQRARPQPQKHVAQLADRRVGQDAFQVGLRQRNQRGQQGREPADAGHDELGVGRGNEQRRTAGHHVDARRDHRGRVDQGADRRGTFHRVGQPDVQRELGTLAAGPQHQQQADRRGHAAAHKRGRRRSEPLLAQHARDQLARTSVSWKLSVP